MKTKWTMGCLAACITGFSAEAQPPDWNTAGNNITTFEWFGAGTLSTIPLSFETRVNQPMLWRTDNTARMRLSGTVTGQTINTYGPLDLSGYLGIGNFTIAAYPHPAARVHTERSSSFTLGYRDVIGDGFLATQGERLFYAGLLGGSANSGVMWSQVTGINATQGAFKFIYTGNDGTSTTVASGADGLELGRFQPAPSLNEGFFGIGDWTSAGVGVLPSERLDVLDGRARIRQLPDDAAPTADFDVMVVDNSTSSTERGVVKRVPVSTISGLGDCDWIVDPTASTTDFDICTAYAGSSCLWNNMHNVGVGLTTPKAKVDVVKDYTMPGTTQDFGVRVRMSTENIDNFGFHSDVAGYQPQGSNFGGYFNATNAGRCYGAYGQGSGSYTNYGLFGAATSTALANFGAYVTASNGSGVNYAIYATSPVAANNYAGWFQGDVKITNLLDVNGIIYPSDAGLKDNIAPLTNAMDVISQFEPMTYTYDTVSYAAMSLPSAAQAGLIAQDVEAIVPGVVSHTVFPAQYDSTGAMTSPGIPYAGIDYARIVPYLIGAVQEQNARIDQLEFQLAACCAASPTDGTQMFGAPGSGSNGMDVNGGERNMPEQLRIQPNPMTNQATITYVLTTPGQVRLLVSTSAGRQLRVLEESQRTQGTFTYDWNTSDLASGMYNVMLLVDGMPMVQKAVKIDR